LPPSLLEIGLVNANLICPDHPMDTRGRSKTPESVEWMSVQKNGLTVRSASSTIRKSFIFRFVDATAVERDMIDHLASEWGMKQARDVANESDLLLFEVQRM
jgi:hypothetical protein